MARGPDARWWRRAVVVLGVVGVLLVGGPFLWPVIDPPVEVERVAPAPAPVVPTAPAPAAPVVPAPVQAAVEAADATVTRAGAVVGIALLDRTTGTLATNDEAAEPMNAASLAKVLTAVDVLSGGSSSATDDDRALLRAALGPSDDPAMNTLWSRHGGAAGIARVVDRLSLTDTALPGEPSQWGEVQLSARDTTTVLRFVLEGLAPTDAELLRSTMSDAPARAADGFDQAYGLLDPDRRSAAAKQGWLCCLDSSIDLHTAGFLDGDGRYVLAILSNQPFGYAAARTVLDDATGAIRDRLGV
ncbi:class A beta-lactamase-related serine hydrolase [Actinomycetospora endophytica]|uniref:Class A beta-lactamase-related serine hydrolase n=1 Tax=Actinomycetospora endophytica TaxID=2291215 RepID=A0ABS8P664_9PSEU|nr:class A beta-lactamase-related serine hydrolase [Actinomycetospora endophytica]MCD2193040.1 class A beta-lactamase-related serine hydrolase [Actinomycetospora endophytica]